MKGINKRNDYNFIYSPPISSPLKKIAGPLELEVPNLHEIILYAS